MFVAVFGYNTVVLMWCFLCGNFQPTSIGSLPALEELWLDCNFLIELPAVSQQNVWKLGPRSVASSQGSPDSLHISLVVA